MTKLQNFQLVTLNISYIENILIFLPNILLNNVLNQLKQILKRKLLASAEERQTIPKKEKKVWNCIEERIQNKTEFGTTIRKIIFGDVYIDEISALSKKPFEDFANLRVSSF